MRLSDLVRQQAAQLPGAPPLRQAARACPPVSLLSPTRDDAPIPAPVLAVADWYARAQCELAKIGVSVRANSLVPVDGCTRVAAEVVERLHASDDLIQCVMAGDVEDYQAANALHVAILSVKIAMGLQYDSAALERLALAGLLHDLGMWLMPQGIIEKPGSLDEEERAVICAHPEEGRRIIAGMGESCEWLATAIAQEHERWDGSGYPCRLKGTDITEPAQIIGLADMLDALITPRPYHARLMPHQALRKMLVEHSRTFQPRLLKTMVDQLSLYPVGTAVRLNDGHVGVVSRVNPRCPLRPVLLVRRTQDGRTTGGTDPLDLSHETSRHIVEVLPATRAA